MLIALKVEVQFQQLFARKYLGFNLTNILCIVQRWKLSFIFSFKLLKAAFGPSGLWKFEGIEA